MCERETVSNACVTECVAQYMIIGLMQHTQQKYITMCDHNLLGRTSMVSASSNCIKRCRVDPGPPLPATLVKTLGQREVTTVVTSSTCSTTRRSHTRVQSSHKVQLQGGTSFSSGSPVPHVILADMWWASKPNFFSSRARCIGAPSWSWGTSICANHHSSPEAEVSSLSASTCPPSRNPHKNAFADATVPEPVSTPKPLMCILNPTGPVFGGAGLDQCCCLELLAGAAINPSPMSVFWKCCNSSCPRS
jgi:hypothetical protein